MKQSLILIYTGFIYDPFVICIDEFLECKAITSKLPITICSCHVTPCKSISAHSIIHPSISTYSIIVQLVWGLLSKLLSPLATRYLLHGVELLGMKGKWRGCVSSWTWFIICKAIHYLAGPASDEDTTIERTRCGIYRNIEGFKNTKGTCEKISRTSFDSDLNLKLALVDSSVKDYQPSPSRPCFKRRGYHCET